MLDSVLEERKKSFKPNLDPADTRARETYADLLRTQRRRETVAAKRMKLATEEKPSERKQAESLLGKLDPALTDPKVPIVSS